MRAAPLRLWIDLSNTPHVLFFEPVIRELERRGYAVTVTARRFAGTLALAQARGLSVLPIGAGHDACRDERLKKAEHRRRTAELIAFARRGFDLAVSHCSFTQAAAARHLGIPVFGAIDYEYLILREFRDARRLMVPSVIPPAAFGPAGVPETVIRHYDGLKEHVYLAGFRPDPALRVRLGVGAGQRLVTFRPIADHAIYNIDSGAGLQRRLLERLAGEDGVCVLILPRTAAQRAAFESLVRGRPSLRLGDGTLHGPSLICASDLVVCGGGTMLREAAVLGVPTVSIFPGPLGAVDRWLASEGRVRIVRAEDEVEHVHVAHRPPHPPPPLPNAALAQIVQGICDSATGR